jgi:hypothetical protein
MIRSSWGEVRLLYDWRSVSMSWYRVPLWDLRPDITYWRNAAVWNPLWREDGSAIFTDSSDTPPTWRARFRYLYIPIWDSMKHGFSKERQQVRKSSNIHIASKQAMTMILRLVTVCVDVAYRSLCLSVYSEGPLCSVVQTSTPSNT